MKSYRFGRTSFLVAVVVGLCAMGAMASHHHHCEGYWCGYLFDYGGDEQEGDCYSCGDWHATIDTQDGELYFHFTGDTEDYYCFGEKGTIYEYCPQWVAEELFYECGYCIEYCDKTKYSIDHHGHVSLKVWGYAYPCYDEECEECGD